MKKAKGIIVALVILIVAAICAALFIANKPAVTDISTEAQSETVSEKTEKEAQSITVEWTEEESSTEETTTEEQFVVTDADYDAVKSGVWYLYDDDEKTAYTFEFTGKDRVEVAYFDSNNTAGLDAKYFTTSEDYEINNVEGEIIVELDDPINENESFMFTLQKGKLCFGKDKLDNEKEVSLDTVFNHFN